jgi:hypothetical protein
MLLVATLSGLFGFFFGMFTMSCLQLGTMSGKRPVKLLPGRL